jgi:hypothetical protein
MANLIVTAKIKYRVSRRHGHKEVEQYFDDFEQTINLSEANFTLLRAALSGIVDVADGMTE